MTLYTPSLYGNINIVGGKDYSLCSAGSITTSSPQVLKYSNNNSLDKSPGANCFM